TCPRKKPPPSRRWLAIVPQSAKLLSAPDTGSKKDTKLSHRSVRSPERLAGRVRIAEDISGVPPGQLQKRIAARLVVAAANVEPGEPRETLELFDLEAAARQIALQEIGPIHLVETNGLSADGRDENVVAII